MWIETMWLTVAQLAGLLNISEQAVRKSVVGKRYISARYLDSSRGGNGGKVWEISAYDPAIPASVRKTLELPETAYDPIKKTIEEAGRMSIAPELLNDGKTALRLRVLRRIAERPEGVKKGDWKALVAKEEGVSLPTIYRWAAEAERGKVTSDKAPVALAVKAESGPLRVAVKSRCFPPQALEYGISLLMKNPRKDVKCAYAELEIKAATEGWEMGSLRSFYRAVHQLPQAVSILASAGRRGLEAVAKPALGRDMSKVNVYDILIGDQHIFDYIVVDDDGEPVRPQMFAWVDAKSRFFSGIWPVMGNYDQFAVGFALREACRYGLPKSLYNDWGKPEGSNYIEQLRRQLSNKTAFKNGYDELWDVLPQVKAKPRNAQAKAIESYFFHAFENPLMQKGLPGYARRDTDDKKNEFIQESLRKQTKGKKLLHVKAFLEIVLEVVDDWHKHIMTEDRTIPEEVFAGGISHLHRFDDQTLDFLFWPATKRMVRNSKIQMTLPGFGKREWCAPELSAFCSRGKREKVEVRFNPYDASKIYVLASDTQKLICIAEEWGKVDPFDREAVSDKIRRQNQIVGWWRDIFRQLSKPEIRIHRFTPYKGAAAEVVKLEEARDGFKNIMPDPSEVDRKIINLSEELDRVAKLEKLLGGRKIAREG